MGEREPAAPCVPRARAPATTTAPDAAPGASAPAGADAAVPRAAPPAAAGGVRAAADDVTGVQGYSLGSICTSRGRSLRRCVSALRASYTTKPKSRPPVPRFPSAPHSIFLLASFCFCFCFGFCSPDSASRLFPRLASLRLDWITIVFLAASVLFPAAPWLHRLGAPFTLLVVPPSTLDLLDLVAVSFFPIAYQLCFLAHRPLSFQMPPRRAHPHSDTHHGRP
ncbi:hypothetical protein B0H17DRAFT_1109476, partial [Mycena rosella]